MPEALARDTDLSTGQWSVSALRDYFLTLINSNEKRQTAIQDAHNHDIQAVRDMVGALDVRYEQRFKSQEVAIERGHSTALQLSDTKEKGIYSTITAHVEAAKNLAIKLEVLGTAREEVMREAILAVRRKAEMIEKQADQNAQVLRDLPVALDLKYLSARMVDEKSSALHAAIVAVDQRAIQSLAALREIFSLALLNADKAVTKAEEAATRKFECVSADTPILCRDLVWRPAGELTVGTELIGFDEESPTRHGRRFRPSVVTAHSLQKDKLLNVNTSHGSMRCNPQHPWLVLQGKRRTDRHHWIWVEAKDLSPGDQVMRPADVWTTDVSWESGWLAGMYDGEGCLSFLKQSNKSIRNSEGSVTSYLGVHLSLSQRESPTATRIMGCLSGLVDILKILGSIRPPRLMPKADGVWDGRPINGLHRETFVTSVEDAGRGMIAAMSTSTKTYIAGGYASHNSVNEFRNTLADQQRTLMPRTEVEVMVKNMNEKIESQNNYIKAQNDRIIVLAASREGSSSGMHAGWTAAAAVVGWLFALFALFSKFGK